MAVTARDPNTIHLGGDITRLNEHSAGVAITPGMLIEFYSDGTNMKLRPHASATEFPTAIFATEKLMHNKTVDDVYAINDLVAAVQGHKGSSWWALVPSGQNIVAGDPLQSNGNGMLKKATDTTAGANLAHFQALESTGGAVAVTTRLRIQVL